MTKKVFSIIVMMIFVLQFAANVSAAEPEQLIFNSTEDWKENLQGYKGWTYEYTTDGTFKGYTAMEWTTVKTTTAYHGRTAENKILENFRVGQVKMHVGGGKLKAARVWTAPYSGVVRLKSIGNVKRDGYCAGCTHNPKVIEARIIKTDRNRENEEVLNTINVQPNDNIGANNTYNFDAKVECGDKIYFEVGAESAAHGGVEWATAIEYIQAVHFESDGKKIEKISDLSADDMLKCSLYAKDAVKVPVNTFLVVYDEKGLARAISLSPGSVNPDGWVDKKVDVSIRMPEADDGSYDGWNVRFLAFTAEEDRYWPISLSDMLKLD